MTIAVIGANGQVGTELCYLLRSRGHSVRPIVRSQIAVSTFEADDFEYAVADITEQNQASEALSDVDTVIVTAFAPYYSRGELRPRKAREANNKLLEHAIECSPEDTTVIYFSSIVAYGDEIGLSRINWYGREKRRIEDRCQTLDDRNVYVFRLGHVFGCRQSFTREIKARSRGSSPLRVAANPEAKSNVVHSVTVADAIEGAAERSFDPGLYTVVNNPQWTWKDIFEYHAEGPVLFVDEQELSESFAKRVLSRFVDAIPLEPTELLTVSPYLPGFVNRYVHATFLRQHIAGEINDIKSRGAYTRSEFGYEPVPDSLPPGIPETAPRLRDAVDVGMTEEDLPPVEVRYSESETPL